MGSCWSDYQEARRVRRAAADTSARIDAELLQGRIALQGGYPNIELQQLTISYRVKQVSLERMCIAPIVRAPDCII